MGKSGGRYFGGGKSSKKRKDDSDVSGRPDQSSTEFYHDAVDEFHHDKDKIYLDKAKRKTPANVDEEVFAIRSDDEDEEGEEDDTEDQIGFVDNEAEEAADDDSDIQSDLSGEVDEEGYLPSADAWGTRRKAYYSTDFVGDDRAGLSGSDIEAADLEEQEAISLQKRLVQEMTDDDFKLDTDETSPKKQVQTSIDKEKDVVQTDLSSLSEEEKLELLKQQSPELLPLIEEYQTRSEMAHRYLEPISNALVNYIQDNRMDPRTRSMFDWISKKYELYMNYLLNLQFYFILKAMRQPVDNHPVIDRIMSLKKLVDEMNSKYSHLEGNVKRLAKILEGGSSIDDVIHLIGATGTGAKSKSKSTPKMRNSLEGDEDPKKKHVRFRMEEEEEDDGEIEEEEDGMEETNDGQDGTEKRGVSREIERNKGLTPNRKKEQRNPRVKNRMRFKKAVHKKKSQLPDARKELQKYGGEIRGIKANLVRSVKLH